LLAYVVFGQVIATIDLTTLIYLRSYHDFL
jgi:hypothetical protein